MIHKYWDLQFKNEFTEFFAKHEHPRQNGLEVPQSLVEASLDHTSDLVGQVWQVMSKFEESCAASLSDMLIHTSQSNLLKVASTSAYLIFKIEGLFTALDIVDRLKQSQGQTGIFEIKRNWGLQIDIFIGIAMEQKQKILCNKIVALFTHLISTSDTNGEVSQESISLVTVLAHNLKLLIRIGLQAAWSLNTNSKGPVVSTFLANIKKTTEQSNEQSMQSKIYKKIRDNDYVSRHAHFCSLCQKSVEVFGSQGCYWTHTQIYHIDCVRCSSCNECPKFINRNDGYSSVKWSHCNHRGILRFISQILEPDFVILDSRSLVWTHLLYVAWARLAQTLRPNVAPCT